MSFPTDALLFSSIASDFLVWNTHGGGTYFFWFALSSDSVYTDDVDTSVVETRVDISVPDCPG